jgi:hypothetical protein
MVDQRTDAGAMPCILKPRNMEVIMNDNVLEPGPQPDDYINVLVESELAYWTRELGVSRERLAEAIVKVGGRVADVRAYFAAPAH